MTSCQPYVVGAALPIRQQSLGLVIAAAFVVMPSCAQAPPLFRPTTVAKEERPIAEAAAFFSHAATRTIMARAKPTDNVLFAPIGFYALVSHLRLAASGKTRQALDHLVQSYGGEALNFETSLKQWNRDLAANPESCYALEYGYFLRDEAAASPVFRDEIAAIFSTSPQVLNWTSSPAKSLNVINQWVKRATLGLIETWRDQPPSSGDVALFMQAFALKAKWIETFPRKHSAVAAFTTSAGAVVQATFMDDTRAAWITPGDDTTTQVARLEFTDPNIDVIFILPPKQVEWKTWLSQWSWENLKRDLDAMEPAERLWWKLPRLAIEMNEEPHDLGQLAQDMGCKACLSGEFNRMAPGQAGAWSLEQKAIAHLDEEGVRAAALSSGLMSESAARQFWLDRPYLVGLRHRSTQTMLFWIKVADPTSAAAFAYR